MATQKNDRAACWLMRGLAVWTILMLAPVVWAQGQGTPQQPVLSALQTFYQDAKRNTLEAADALPEGDYGFRPKKESRTFGQQLAHVADANYLFCSSALGEENPYPGVAPGTPGVFERTKTKKAEIIEALKASFTYCNRAFATTDEALGHMVDFVTPAGTRSVPRAFALTVLIYHTGRHYGSAAVYLRLKGVVPPSTQRLNAARSGSR